MFDLLIYGIVGGIGGFIKQLIIGDGILILPNIEKHKLNLGFVANMIIGAFVAVIVDHHPFTALLAGYAGSDIIEKAFTKIKTKSNIWAGSRFLHYFS